MDDTDTTGLVLATDNLLTTLGDWDADSPALAQSRMDLIERLEAFRAQVTGTDSETGDVV